MNITEEIKEIIINFIEKEYQKYLKDNNILLIQNHLIDSTINDLYENNSKTMKATIRSVLKEKYKDDYPSASVENIIFDIFQDKELNISKVIDEIHFIQKKNYKLIEIPIIDNTLNLNISVLKNYVVINSINSKNIKDYNDLYYEISKFKFIYSINSKILDEYITDTEKINIIKEEIKNKNYAQLGLYYLKN